MNVLESERPAAQRTKSRRLTRSPASASVRFNLNRDRIMAGVMFLLALPVMSFLWIAVKLTSPGPGLYCQRRVGLAGREFFIYKLRTMTVDCERATGAVWASIGDARVTCLGGILRRTHLDELPQLFNVLMGDMALVGPRPERPEIIEQLLSDVPDYLDRLRVRPGVTGLAQIWAPADQSIADVERKLRYDLQYMAMASPWLDARIIFCTALKMVGLNRWWVRALLFPSLAGDLRQHLRHKAILSAWNEDLEFAENETR